MVKYRLKVFAIMAGLFLVLLNYQNCSPAAGGPELNQTGVATGSEMDMIDLVNAGNINFIEEKVSLQAEDTDLVVYGVCGAEQHGSLIGWKLYDDDGTKIEQGRSICERGAFEVAFEGTDAISCGSYFLLKAQFGAKAKSQMSIEKPCY